MLGAIIGDIAGSRYEFDPVKTTEFELFPAGSTVTDDTIMTCAVAEVLLELADQKSPDEAGAEDADAKSEDEIRQAFCESMHRWGAKYPDAGYGGRFSHWLATGSKEPYGSYGNGSAMRVSPVGWLFDDLETTRRVAALSAATTHDHPEGIKGAEAVACAIYLARTGSTKEQIRNYIEEEFGYDLSRRVEDIRPTYEFDATCQGSVPEAICCYLQGDTYEEIIRLAISLGGDADTQATIAGSIAEASHILPPGMVEQARKIMPEDVNEVVDRLYERIKTRAMRASLRKYRDLGFEVPEELV